MSPDNPIVPSDNLNEARRVSGKGKNVQVKVVDRRPWTLRRAAGESQGEEEAAGADMTAKAPPTGADEEAAPHAAEERRLPSYVQELHDRTEQAERRAQEVLAAYRQSQLEQDEFRKRLARDVERRADAEVANSLQALLDVVDDLERALRHADEGLTGGESPAFQGLLEGVRLVRDRFLSVLRERGVERLEVAGERFDPEKAEAVRTVEVKDETRDGIVLEEIQPGYLYKGHLLRPARVAVGRLTSPPRARQG
ncbi:MAG: nucleotide exchange factor GrpE [Acidobacteria bacterium]|nr:MAG: nucleotide exchange factor GrpE [Acidobacteriota bacterium]